MNILNYFWINLYMYVELNVFIFVLNDKIKNNIFCYYFGVLDCIFFDCLIFNFIC